MSRYNKQKKIMYIVSYFPSTSQTFVLRELKRLWDLGYEIEICAMRTSDKEIKHPDVDIFKDSVFYIPDLGRRKSSLLPLVSSNFALGFKKPIIYLKALGKALKARSIRVILDFLRAGWVVSKHKLNPDLHLHSQFAHNPTNIAYFIHLLNGNTFSFTSHAVDLYVNPTLMKEKLENSRFAVTISEYNKSLLKEQYGLESVSNLHIVRCGIEKGEVNTTNPIVKKEENRTLTILTIGRMVEKKGFDVLVDALELLMQQDYNFECRIIGGGELQDQIIQSVHEKGLEKHVHFLGAKSADEVQREFGKADMFVLPCKKAENGDMDGIPVVLMEAIANKVPVVTTRLSGIPELVIHNQTGLLAEPNDPISLVDQITTLIEKPDIRINMTVKAVKHLVNEFLLEDNVDKLAELMESELKGRAT
jgi:colanic acid/amylovoran biosynthesis glycosyltransferase